eukprot:6574542-Prorocentrum_lima.AAC.1
MCIRDSGMCIASTCLPACVCVWWSPLLPFTSLMSVSRQVSAMCSDVLRHTEATLALAASTCVCIGDGLRLCHSVLLSVSV